jgi:hypothetical protein
VVTSIDTLEIANRLRGVGFDDRQAEAISTVLRDIHDADLSRLATKEDLATVRAELSAEIAALRSELSADIKMVRSEIEILRRDLTIRLGGMIVVLGGFLAAIKFLG